MSAGIKAKAREGLLATDHSKRGRRYVTLLDAATKQVTLLEAWEHAVLALCDGRREPQEIVELLGEEVEGQAIDREVVDRCLKFFERQSLIHPAGLRSSSQPPPGPVTLGQIQAAHAEWHSEPPKTAQHSSQLPPPFPRTGVRAPVGLEPTVALPKKDEADGTRAEPVRVGGTLTLEGIDSVLGPGGAPAPSPIDRAFTDGHGRMVDLLAAVDDAVAEAHAVEAAERMNKRRQVDTAEIEIHESRPIATRVDSVPPGQSRPKVEVSSELENKPRPSTPALRASFRPPAESILMPTMVGRAPEPSAEPSAAVRPSQPPRKLAELIAAEVTETETRISRDTTPVRRRTSEPTQKLDLGPSSALEESEPTQLGKMIDSEG